MPNRPWVMTQTWSDLLFAHWRVPAEVLASQLPAGLELDCFDGEAWLGIVPFRMSNVAPRGGPALPAFPEVNVRTYARIGDRPGVFFFSLDATNPLAIVTARTLLRLPYRRASMTIEARGDTVTFSSRRRSRREPRDIEVTYAPVDSVDPPRPGTLEYFLTERYCLYTTYARTIARVEIHHPPWLLQRAEARFALNTMPGSAKVDVGTQAPLLHFAKRQDVVAWTPEVAARSHARSMLRA